MDYVGTYNSSLQAVLARKSGGEGIQVQNRTAVNHLTVV